ncbi:cadmium-translocating P-type ATPase [Clostridium sp. P21]|uniref:Cadmium-translocating P-type ATPase n=1 Tax=Clostridium muellerianum TaxID=2716538 RepID=A0A7Y0EF95_9CLOT|nr:heavy metal translocating P-type ATPase [Clostridium muellerianum]NMM62301.1 cadmium-translocating P-type ATPase [Clostridium muellerianum]
MKKEFILEGLGCANCAAKMERNISGIKGITNVSVNFMTKSLALEIEEISKTDELIAAAEKVVKNIESQVVMKEKVLNKKLVQEKSHSHNGHVHEHEHNHGEQLKKKELIKLSIGTAIFVIASVFQFSFWVEASLYIISYLLIGGEVVIRALKNISKGQVFDENFLMSIATIGAFSIQQFPEAVAVMLFYQVGELFQDAAVNNSRKSISSLMDIRPDFANLKRGDKIEKVTPEEVKVGDFIIVRPGEKVPLDGVIIEGKSMLDTSALTGESVPREAVINDTILGGFINKNGVLTIKVTKEFSESTSAKIINLVENASSKKAPTEKFITKFARYYTPVVVISAVLLAVIPPLVISGSSFSQWIYRALVFLVVSCPCALVISIPLGFFGGIGGASKNGILIKGGNYLEALNNVEMVVFDKTGTLTKGTFKVTEIAAFNNMTKEEILEYAAFAESYSNHPIATSILKAYDKEIDKSSMKNYEEISGHGVRVNINEKEVLCGNIKLMDKEKICYSKVDTFGTVIYVAIDKNYSGYIVISDEVKEDAKTAVQGLKGIGIKKTVMLTGDNKVVGSKVGQELGVDEVYSELLPQNKVEKLESIEKEKSPKGKLIFVGDGINDAPVLARADVGIAMGGVGSDAAIEAADVVIMTDEPSKIVTAIKIAKRTKNIVMQNIVFALGVKIIILVLGALGIANMWEAVFGDVGVAIIAILNSMRALKVKNA